MKKIFFLLTWIIITGYSFSQQIQKINTDNFLFPNFRVYPSTVTQTEILAANHPYEEGTLFVTANTISFPDLFVSEGIYVTTDYGSSWSGSDTCNGANINFHNGDPGITIDKNGTFILTRLGRIPFLGLYSHYSTDKGLTWSPAFTMTQDDALERAALGSDNNHLSSYFGRSYAVWVKYSPPYPVIMSYTDNSAVSWTAPVAINNPPNRCVGGDMTMGLDSKVHAIWAGVTNTSPFKEINVGFASSSNGGLNWSVSEIAFEMNGIKGYLPEKQNIRVDGLPKIAVDTTGGVRNGWIYIVTTQINRLPAGNDADIILNRSTDGGITWSPALRVNQDNMNNGKIQYFPAVHVDNYGAVNIIYYDDRNTTADSAGVFLSRSTDGGDTWNDYEISDHNFRPNSIGGLGFGYQGDNIAVTSMGNYLFPFWMDNSSGIYQVWSSKINLTLVDVKEIEQLPQEFKLYQNYPNPFNPTTVVEFSIPESSPVEIVVTDLKGSAVVLERKDYLHPGNYKYNFNAGGLNLTSGIYFITIKAGKYRETIKAVYLK